MADVELLENHQLLYKKDEMGARVEDNQLSSRGGADKVSLIFVQKKQNKC